MSATNVKLFEKFLSDNKLELTKESGVIYCDMADTDVEVLAEEYIEYAASLRSKPAKIRNLERANVLDPNNFISKILICDEIRDKRNNIVDADKVRIGLSGKYKFYDILVDTANDVYSNLVKDGIINEATLFDKDIYDCGYRVRGYLWLLKRLYLNYIESWLIDDAISVGERILAINPKDNVNILDSLPYLYISKGDFNEAELLLVNKEIDNVEYHFVKSFILLKNKKYDELINELSEIKSANPFLLELIVIKFENAKLDDLINATDNDYSYAVYLYYNACVSDKMMDELREFILENIEL